MDLSSSLLRQLNVSLSILQKRYIAIWKCLKTWKSLFLSEIKINKTFFLASLTYHKLWICFQHNMDLTPHFLLKWTIKKVYGTFSCCSNFFKRFIKMDGCVTKEMSQWCKNVCLKVHRYRPTASTTHHRSKRPCESWIGFSPLLRCYPNATLLHRWEKRYARKTKSYEFLFYFCP